eukprot:2202671-Amphidinium_carterae.1
MSTCRLAWAQPAFLVVFRCHRLFARNKAKDGCDHSHLDMFLTSFDALCGLGSTMSKNELHHWIGYSGH